MLCSHQYKFIYLKTLKTAGTSVEIFFERFCQPTGAYQEQHRTSEIITPQGIVGARGANADACQFYNHMPASRIRELLGNEIWSAYLKFCVIRNPYDKVVSMFWMQLPEGERKHYAQAAFSAIKDRFAQFCSRHENLPRDQAIIGIDGEEAADCYLRYENLHDDMANICSKLSISFNKDALGNYKSNFRKIKTHFSEYYTPETADFIAENYSWEIKKFGYTLAYN